MARPFPYEQTQKYLGHWIYPPAITYFEDAMVTPQTSQLPVTMALHGERPRRAHAQLSLDMCVDEKIDVDPTPVPYRSKSDNPHTGAQRARALLPPLPRCPTPGPRGWTAANEHWQLDRMQIRP